MANIGGNITGVFQVKTVQTDEFGKIVKNEVAEAVYEWLEKASATGWLGMQSGDSKHSNFNAKIEESTHVFLCDYNDALYALSLTDESGAAYDVRAIFKGVVYDVLLIDNPDEMNEQLEIYLRKVGAWRGE